MVSAYLAGPDVFLPDAASHARRKIVICERYGIRGLPPLNEDIAALAEMHESAAGLAIFRKDVEMMEAADIIIANLTPLRGASADAGTLVEIGWFMGRGKPIFGYSNTAVSFTDRSRAQVAALPDPMAGLAVEGFGLPDNLMVPGAVLSGGLAMLLPENGVTLAFDALDVFERCVAAAAAHLGVAALPAGG
jgi:nucleoside 2-deoxyribosyltransferase